MDKRFFLAPLVAVLLFSCGSFTSYKGEKYYIDQESGLILDALNKHDKEGLIALFSADMKKSESFRSKIDSVIDAYRCDTYVSAQIPATASGSKAWAHGVVEWTIDLEVYSIRTFAHDELSDRYGDDRFYSFHYIYCIVDKETPSLEGLNFFELNVYNRQEITIQNAMGAKR